MKLCHWSKQGWMLEDHICSVVSNIEKNMTDDASSPQKEDIQGKSFTTQQETLRFKHKDLKK